MKAYATFYLRNLRLLSAARFFLQHRKPIMAAGMRVLSRAAPWSRGRASTS